MYFQLTHPFRSSGAATCLSTLVSINIWSLWDRKQKAFCQVNFRVSPLVR